MARECKIDPDTGIGTCCGIDGRGKMNCWDVKDVLVPGSKPPLLPIWTSIATILLVTFLVTLFSGVPMDRTRNFGVDYLFFDAAFLGAWIFFSILLKKWTPLVIGAILAIPVYFIDAVIWWNTGIRETITPVPKFFVDFMMTISYAIVAFSWAVMALRGDKDAPAWGLFLLGGWLAIAFASQYFPLFDAPVWTTRHMGGTEWITYGTLASGYIVLGFLRVPATNIGKVFLTAISLGFFMEFSLWISGIRPTGIDVVFYGSLMLINQGMPWIYIIARFLFPSFIEKARERELFDTSIFE